MVAGGVRFGPGGLLARGGFSSVLEGGVGAGSKSQAQGWGGGRFQAEGRPVRRPEVIEGGEGVRGCTGVQSGGGVRGVVVRGAAGGQGQRAARRMPPSWAPTSGRGCLFCVKRVYCCTNSHVTKQAKYRRM